MPVEFCGGLMPLIEDDLLRAFGKELPMIRIIPIPMIIIMPYRMRKFEFLF
jgi:hypothetical protein